VKEAGASLVFETENDLVVNTPSMAVLARHPEETLIPANKILDFGITDTVYHTVYFRQKQTVDFIRKSLSIGLEPSDLASRTGRRRRKRRPA